MKIETAKDPNGQWFVLVDGLQDCDIPYSATEDECHTRAKHAYPREVIVSTRNHRHYSRAPSKYTPD